MFTFDLVYSLSLGAFLSFNIDHVVSQISDLALLKCSILNVSRPHYTALEKVLVVDTQQGTLFIGWDLTHIRILPY